MPGRFFEMLEDIRREIDAPELSPGEPGSTARAFQVVLAPAFHPPFAITVNDCGDHATVTLHGQSSELVQWEDGRHGWRRREGGIWREAKTVIGEPLHQFHRSIEEIAVHRMRGVEDQIGRDGILIALTTCVGDRKSVIETWSPEFNTSPARLTRALVQIATATLRFEESHALLRGIDRYAIMAPEPPLPGSRQRRVKRTPVD